MSTCGEKCEVYSRVCGYYRPVTNWNKGKREEFRERKKFRIVKHDRFYDIQMGTEVTTTEMNAK